MGGSGDSRGSSIDSTETNSDGSLTALVVLLSEVEFAHNFRLSFECHSFISYL